MRGNRQHSRSLSVKMPILFMRVHTVKFHLIREDGNSPHIPAEVNHLWNIFQLRHNITVILKVSKGVKRPFSTGRNPHEHSFWVFGAFMTSARLHCWKKSTKWKTSLWHWQRSKSPFNAYNLVYPCINNLGIPANFGIKEALATNAKRNLTKWILFCILLLLLNFCILYWTICFSLPQLLQQFHFIFLHLFLCIMVEHYSACVSLLSPSPLTYDVELSGPSGQSCMLLYGPLVRCREM